MKQSGFNFGDEGRKALTQAPIVAGQSTADHPANWRAPTEGEVACSVCAGAACYAMGALAWCTSCVPASFLPRGRGL